MTDRNSSAYQQQYLQASTDPEAFWAEQADTLAWYKKPTEILTRLDADHYQWFADGELNSCYLALDHQIEQGRGAQTALIYDSAVTGKKTTF